MLRRVDHSPHHTASEVTQYLAAALTLVEELDVPEDLRVPLFVKAVDLLSSHQITYEQITTNTGGMAIPKLG